MKQGAWMMCIAVLLAAGTVSAQNDSARGVTRAEFDDTLDALKRLKMSGYIQSQFQAAEGRGISSVAGGNFPANVRSRFSVRRGRLKFAYAGGLTRYVLQVDVSQNGVGIKDAYVSLEDPWDGTFGLTAGVFDRPFGFEIMYSSGAREMPERARMIQVLFPGDRELGAKLEILPAEGPFRFFNLRAGVFNGVLPNANENNGVKDFIGRAGVRFPFPERNASVDGGVSLYAGKVTNTSKFVHSIDRTAAVKRYVVDSTASNLGGDHGRVYYGGDVQISFDVFGFGGTSLRGEAIAGSQPGTAGSGGFYNPYAAGGAAEAATPLYKRRFAGWYAAIVQNVGDEHQLIGRYDRLDPNTDVRGADVGIAGSNLSAADLAVSTLGVGWIYHYDASLKIVLYYDVVKNERAAPAASGSLADLRDDLHDNVLTLRTQFRF